MSSSTTVSFILTPEPFAPLSGGHYIQSKTEMKCRPEFLAPSLDASMPRPHSHRIISPATGILFFPCVRGLYEIPSIRTAPPSPVRRIHRHPLQAFASSILLPTQRPPAP